MLPILTFHFEFLVIVVDQFAVHAFDELVVLVGGIFGHGEKLSAGSNPGVGFAASQPGAKAGRKAEI
jgi:hypothetical protein